MLTIYHVSGTRSVRPISLCHELDLPLPITTVDFSPQFRATPQWRAISPAGKETILTDGDLTMFESDAMVDDILERYGQGRLRQPSGTEQSALRHRWCGVSEVTLIGGLGPPPLTPLS